LTINEGEALEYRVGNVAFCQGYLSRRRIPVRQVFYPDRVDVSDIDVLGIRFDSNFGKHMALWECKAGLADGTVDRILWLLGLSQYSKAEFKGIVRPKVPDRVKLFATSMGVEVWDYEVLAHNEKIFGAASPIGYNNPTVYYQREIDNYRTIRDVDRLSKAYWYLKATFWFEPAETRIKRTLTAISYCQEEVNSLKKEIAQAAKDLLCEGMVLTSVAVLDFAGQLSSWRATSHLKEQVSQRLTSGLGTEAERNEIIQAALEYTTAMKGAKARRTPPTPLQVPPPKYTEPLVDLMDRFYERPTVAQRVPRLLDLLTYESIIPGKEVDKSRVKLFFGEDVEILAKMSKNVVTFLERATGFPTEVVESGFRML